jgi:stress response protein SCP2
LRQDYNNLVYYNSDPWRWKTERPIDTNDFNPLKGEVAKWPECANKFMSNDDWFFSTLPLSVDESVIGSWDDKGGNVDGGDEKLHVRLNKINTKFYRSIAIVASIHQGDEGGKRLTFSEISNPCVNIFDADTKEHDIEYRLNNDDNSEFECVIVGYVKFNDVTRKWDYVTANKGFESFESAIKHHW